MQIKWKGMLLVLIALVLGLFLYFYLQLSSMRTKLIEVQQEQKVQAIALNHLGEVLPNQPKLQAILIQTLLANLQTLFLQAQPKAVLLQASVPLFSLLGTNTDPQVKVLSQQLQNELQALPAISVSQAALSLKAMKTTLSSLSFVPPATYSPASSTDASQEAAGFWARLWQHIQPLLVVRTENQIGSQFVTDVGRIDALRSLNAMIDEAVWQLMTEQDPSLALNQLKAAVSTATVSNTAQAVWLDQLNAFIQSNAYYTTLEMSSFTGTIAQLQRALAV